MADGSKTKRMISKWLAIAALSAAPFLASAQADSTKTDSAKAPPRQAAWAPCNGASVMANNAVTYPFKPDEVRLVSTASQTQEISALSANYYESAGGMQAGFAAIASRTQAEGSQAGDALSLQAGVGTDKFQVGAKAPLTGTGKLMKSGPLSLQGIYTGSVVRAGIDATPTKGLAAPSAVLSTDVLIGKNDISCMDKAQKGKTPQIGLGMERLVGKGWQAGASIQPDKAFFKGRLNPTLTGRYTSKKSLFHVDVIPQQKTLRVGVGWRF